MIATRYEPLSSFGARPRFRTQRRRSRPLSCRRQAQRNSLDSEDEVLLAHSGDLCRDKFMELAQAALEEATKEEDKGLLQELIEAFVARSGATSMAEVISEQLRSQELIEQIAERHEEKRRMSQDRPVLAGPLKEPHDESVSVVKYSADEPEPVMVAEYLWRLFRLLILASIVGLVYHFVRAYPPSHLIP